MSNLEAKQKAVEEKEKDILIREKQIQIASETNNPYEKDWKEYHNRGIELARKLREQLSDDCDIWYSAPFEDKSGTISGSFLVL